MAATIIISCAVGLCAAAAAAAIIVRRKKRKNKCSGCPYACGGSCKKEDA